MVPQYIYCLTINCIDEMTFSSFLCRGNNHMFKIHDHGQGTTDTARVHVQKNEEKGKLNAITVSGEILN